ncbi:hypothetical protein FDECE_11761 [Fusarium decemcellulare]|nr:hypothetical protein FDECE_11761 [Fusarium decemcellulare]
MGTDASASRIAAALSLTINTSTGPLDERTWKQCVRLGVKGKEPYRIWDIALANDLDWRPVAAESLYHNTQGPSDLSRQDDNSIRLLVKEEYASASKIGFGRVHEELSSRWKEADSASGFMALSSLWRNADSHQLYPIATYEVLWQKATDYHLLHPTATDEISFPLRVVRHIRVFEDEAQKPQEGLVLQDEDSEDKDMDPEWAELRLWNIRKMAKHSNECRRLRGMGHKLVSTTESLIEEYEPGKGPSAANNVGHNILTIITRSWGPQYANPI